MFRSAISCAAIALVIATIAVGCNSGQRDGAGHGIPGVNFNAAHLGNENRFYQSDAMNHARYSHTATTLEDSRVLVVGGSAERHLNALDTAEIYDQSVRSSSATPPASVTGVWVDTDFQGDPISMTNGGRIFHTANLLSSGNVLICGGCPDALFGAGVEESEIFDFQSRIFAPESLQLSDDIDEARVRCTATELPNGKILFAGGQETVNETIIDPTVPPGFPGSTVTIQVFPSSKTVELFDPATLAFSDVIDVTGEDSVLVALRGRFDHVAIPIAGQDNRLGNSDDIIIYSCGVMTLTGQFAPSFKFPAQGGSDSLSQVEYFDPQSRVFAGSPNVQCLARANGARGLNLGQFTPKTPDGVPGVNNIVLLTNGDDDGDSPAGQSTVVTSQTRSEVFAMTFSGFGPAGGIVFQDVSPPAGSQNRIENARLNPLCPQWGRSWSDALMMPNLRTYLDVDQQSNWAVTAGGVYLFPTPAGQGQSLTGTACGSGTEIRGVSFYDPFWTETNIFIDLEMQPADLSENRTLQNPTGVTGAWILGQISPGGVADGLWDAWTEALFLPIARPTQVRAFHTLSRLAGEDGAMSTLDDRFLMAGGGEDYVASFGGEAISINAEVYLPPRANANSAP